MTETTRETGAQARKRMHLRRCPFCASDAAMIQDKRTARGMIVAYFVECRTCGAKGPDSASIYSAHDSWNARSEQKELPL